MTATKAETIAMLKALPAVQRDAVILVFYMDLMEREAAQLLKMTRYRFRNVFTLALKQAA